MISGKETRTKKPYRRTTMRDVARTAGVSQSAVSFVLNDSPQAKNIGKATAVRIRRIAKQLNFHPNHGAAMLKGKRTGVIGALATNWLWVPVRARFLAYLNQTADVRGERILTWQSNQQAEPVEQFVGEFFGRGIDGLIYLAFDNDCEWPTVRPLLAQLPCVVSVMSDPGIAGGSCVVCDVADGTRQAVEHLHGRGRRKIVNVVEGLDTSFNRQRHEAFCRAHEALGRPLEADQLCLDTRGWTDSDLPKFVALAEDLVRRRGADAILADNDIGAAMLIRAAAELGLRVPDDVAVIGWGNETVSRFTNPRLTTVEYRPVQIIEAAMDIVAGMIENPDGTEPKSVTIKPELIVRESG